MSDQSRFSSRAEPLPPLAIRAACDLCGATNWVALVRGKLDICSKCVRALRKEFREALARGNADA